MYHTETGSSNGTDITGVVTFYPPVYTVASREESLAEKSRAVLAALLRKADQYSAVTIAVCDSDVSAAPDDSQTPVAVAVYADEDFAEWVERLYGELCFARGERI